MGRGVKSDALGNSGLDTRYATGYNEHAGDINRTLTPELKSMALNPQGYSPGDLTAMNTASQQSLGGSVAGAVGEGNLEAARTRNAGSFAPALDESVRSAQRQGSQNALGIQEKNADVKQRQQQSALTGLEGLYGQNVNATLHALGLSTDSLNAATAADAQTHQGIQQVLDEVNKIASMGKPPSGGGGSGGGGI